MDTQAATTQAATRPDIKNFSLYRFHPVGREENRGKGGELLVAPVKGEEVGGEDAGLRFALLCVARTRTDFVQRPAALTRY